MTTDAPSPERVAVERLLRDGSWADLVKHLVETQGEDAVVAELAASPFRLSRWIEGSKVRPLTEKLLRRSIAEWLGIAVPNTPATAQASDAEIERLEKEALKAEDAAAEFYNKANAAEHRALAAEAESARLREELDSIRLHATVPIGDGKEMGAVVWRLALEDIVKDVELALAAGTSQEVVDHERT